jgi:hypothetical protein
MFLFMVKGRGSSSSFMTDGTSGTFSWFGIGLAPGDTLLNTGINVPGVFFCILLVISAMSNGFSPKFEDIFT